MIFIFFLAAFLCFGWINFMRNKGRQKSKFMQNWCSIFLLSLGLQIYIDVGSVINLVTWTDASATISSFLFFLTKSPFFNSSRNWPRKGGCLLYFMFKGVHQTWSGQCQVKPSNGGCDNNFDAELLKCCYGVKCRGF